MFKRLSSFMLPALLAVFGSACAAPTDGDEEDVEGSEEALSYVPPAAYREGQLHSTLTPEVIAHLRDIRLSNVGDENKFIKVGDSITFSTDFLRCFARTPATGANASLEGTRRFFTADSWSRESKASKVGWHTNEPLQGRPSRLDTEINEMKPSYAIVMLGTNDTYAGSEPSYRRNLQALINHLSEEGIVPILSTIPPRGTSAANAIVPRMNAVVRRVAAESKIPLIDLNMALSPISGRGLSRDGIHPFASGANACDFSANGLRGGYNHRNLLTLQALDRVRAAIAE
jgi:lysophospholipase L1-like esterase